MWRTVFPVSHAKEIADSLLAFLLLEKDTSGLESLNLFVLPTSGSVPTQKVLYKTMFDDFPLWCSSNASICFSSISSPSKYVRTQEVEEGLIFGFSDFSAFAILLDFFFCSCHFDLPFRRVELLCCQITNKIDSTHIAQKFLMFGR